MHVTLRAEKARGSWSLLQKRTARLIASLIATLGKDCDVVVYEQGNSGNHLHLLLRAKTREGFAKFLRVLTAKLAMKITGGRRGNPLKERFWDRLVWSRLVEFGRAFQIARAYVVKNRLEGLGLIPHVRPPRVRSKKRDTAPSGGALLW